MIKSQPGFTFFNHSYQRKTMELHPINPAYKPKIIVIKPNYFAKNQQKL